MANAPSASVRAVAIGEGGSAISGPAVENGRVKIPILTPLCGDPPFGCAEVVARKTPEIVTFPGCEGGGDWSELPRRRPPGRSRRPGRRWWQ